MSTTTQTTPEGQAPVAVAATPAATPDLAALSDPIAFEKALMEANTNPAELDALLAQPTAKPGNYTGTVPDVGTTPPPAAAPATKPADAAPATPAPAEAPKPADSEDDAPQPEKLGRFRLAARDFREAEFFRLAKSMPAPEAYAKVYGVAQPAAPSTDATQAAAPAAQPAPAESPALTDAKTNLAKLETDLAKATEDADVGAVAKIMREISKAERAIERAEADAQAAVRAKQDEQQTTFRQRESAATKEIATAYPKLGDPASPERAEFQQFINLKFGDPDYEAIFASPLWPKVLGREFAEAKGWNKAAAPVLPAGTPAPIPGAAPAPRVTAAEVLTPGATQGGANITAETFVQDLTKMSLKDLDSLLAAAR